MLWWLSSRPLAFDAPAGSDKVAHVAAYAVLALLFRCALGPGWRSAGIVTFVAALIAAGYGVIDEIHQSFVPGRTPSVTDAVADAVGAALGAFVAGHGRALRRFGTHRSRA